MKNKHEKDQSTAPTTPASPENPTTAPEKPADVITYGVTLADGLEIIIPAKVRVWQDKKKEFNNGTVAILKIPQYFNGQLVGKFGAHVEQKETAKPVERSGQMVISRSFDLRLGAVGRWGDAVDGFMPADAESYGKAMDLAMATYRAYRNEIAAAKIVFYNGQLPQNSGGSMEEDVIPAKTA